MIVLFRQLSLIRSSLICAEFLPRERYSSGPEMSFNPYEVLGLHRDCAQKDIQKAYKVQCLRWHPDKNPDRIEEANKKFIEAKRAVELLLDKEKRSEYDRNARQKEQAEARTRERRDKADGQRRKMMDDLLRREKDFAEKGAQYVPTKTADESDLRQRERMRKQHEEAARDEAEMLRKKWEAEVEAEIKQQQERVSKAAAAHHQNDMAPKLKVSWCTEDKDKDYDSDELRIIFEPYGRIDEIVLVKKKKKSKHSALIVFDDSTDALGAETETGAGGAELSCQWVVPPRTAARMSPARQTKSTAPAGARDFAAMSLDEMEAELFSDFQPQHSAPKKPKWQDDDDDE